MIIVRLLLQTVVLAFGQLWTNKVRALMTTLGIMIGVGAVITTVSATVGLKNFVLKEFDTFGPRKVWMDGMTPRKMRGRVGGTFYDLTLKELDYIHQNASTIDAITPMYFINTTLRAGDVVKVGVPATGIGTEWHEIEKRYVTKGRPFIQTDIDQLRNVCLVNDKAIEELDLENEPEGDYILINDRRFLIVGVVETKEVAAMFPGGGDARTEVFIPVTVALAMQPRLTVNFALAQLKDVELSDECKAEITAILRRLRGLSGDDDNTFVIETVQSAINQIDKIGFVIGAVAGGLVAISLLVGGIGIMNIMLVSVSERTREIGLRKAVGARPGVILMQFLVEAVVLCTTGGLIGVAVSYGMVMLVKFAAAKYVGDMGVPLWSILLSVGFSAGVGIVFGMFPAIKAARLDPIVALRHE